MIRILVIDDSPTVVRATRKSLEAHGYEVQVLTSFTELPHLMREAPPDAILLDLEMPALSGESFAQFIRKCEVRPTPIVIYSSQPKEVIAAAARKLGADGVLEKGAPAEVLRRALAEVLQPGRAGSGLRAVTPDPR